MPPGTPSGMPPGIINHKNYQVHFPSLKKKINWESLEKNIAISRKRIESKMQLKKGQEMEMNDKPKNWKCAVGLYLFKYIQLFPKAIP